MCVCMCVFSTTDALRIAAFAIKAAPLPLFDKTVTRMLNQGKLVAYYYGNWPTSAAVATTGSSSHKLLLVHPSIKQNDPNDRVSMN